MANSRTYTTGREEGSFKKPKNNTGLYITVFLLALGFLVLVAFVFILSASSGASGILTGGKCVALVEVNQVLTTQRTESSLFAQGSPGSEDIAKAIEGLNTRDDVGAVLFVVNSPGGGVVASREIYTAVKELNKPKVAYFREVAASGGYYISAPMDYIIADPNAITGSIGVIATFSDMSGLFEKIGFNVTAITSGEHKDIGSPTRQMTDEERAILQGIVDEVFADFKSVVVENRKKVLNNEKFEEILDGRIITGRQAKEVGLVDALGTKKDALKKAAELGKMEREDPRICEISFGIEEPGLFGLQSLAKLLPSGAQKRVSLQFE